MVKKAQELWNTPYAKAGTFVAALALTLVTGAWGRDVMTGGTVTDSLVAPTEGRVAEIVGDSLRPIRAEIGALRSQGAEQRRQIEFLVCGDLARSGVRGTEQECAANFITSAP